MSTLAELEEVAVRHYNRHSNASARPSVSQRLTMVSARGCNFRLKATWCSDENQVSAFR